MEVKLGFCIPTSLNSGITRVTLAFRKKKQQSIISCCAKAGRKNKEQIMNTDEAAHLVLRLSVVI